MSRAKVALLGLVAALLVFDGPTRAIELDATATAAARVAFGSDDVTAILQRVNPELTAHQRERIAAAVLRYSAKYELDPELVTAVVLVESNGRPWARSPKGAIGLMQIMPHVIVPFEVAGNLATIETNIEGGCLILADNIRRLGEEDGISAYFWGSNIRGLAYLERVRAVRADIRRQAESRAS